MTNYIKAKIVNMQQNSKCIDRDKIREYENKRISRTGAKEYKSLHDWVGKELCKRLKLYHSDKWYM